MHTITNQYEISRSHFISKNKYHSISAKQLKTAATSCSDTLMPNCNQNMSFALPFSNYIYVVRQNYAFKQPVGCSHKHTHTHLLWNCNKYMPPHHFVLVGNLAANSHFVFANFVLTLFLANTIWTYMVCASDVFWLRTGDYVIHIHVAA